VVSAELVWRSGDRKRELLEFSQRPRFGRPFRQSFERRFGESATVDEEQFINFLDFFVLQHRLPDGRTVVEHFVADHPQLPEEERAMLLAGGTWLRGSSGSSDATGMRWWRSIWWTS
jgi:hypothetical protein